jgi:predicted transposase YbfD/YdcC
MKNFKRAVALSAILSTFVSASSDISQKVTKFYNLVTNEAFEFNATKSDNGYKLKILPTNMPYKKIFNPNTTIDISVDEGPTITEPKFTFGKAGLKAVIDVASIFNKEIEQDIKKTLKKSPKINYSAIISFGNNLSEHIQFEPFSFETKDAKIKSSKIDITTDVDLDNYTGVMKLEYPNFIIEPKNEPGVFKLEDIRVFNKITEPPVDNLLLFGDTKFTIKNVEISAQKLKSKFSFVSDNYVRKVNNELLDLYISFDLSTDDVDTIALLKGIKETKTSFLFKNLGTDGLVGFLKLTKEMQDAQDELAAATAKSKGNEAFAKYMATMDSINNKLVPIYNKTFIKDKSKIVLDLELSGNKTSYLKANLLYKANPISGNINVAFISLAAQGLAIFDGDIEIKLDKDLANTINPMAIMVLDMLQTKGFATQKNGVYELKATLKGGNIIINGKSYTLQELSKALF